MTGDDDDDDDRVMRQAVKGGDAAAARQEPEDAEMKVQQCKVSNGRLIALWQVGLPVCVCVCDVC